MDMGQNGRPSVRPRGSAEPCRAWDRLRCVGLCWALLRVTGTEYGHGGEEVCWMDACIEWECRRLRGFMRKKKKKVIDISGKVALNEETYPGRDKSIEDETFEVNRRRAGYPRRCVCHTHPPPDASWSRLHSTSPHHPSHHPGPGRRQNIPSGRRRPRGACTCRTLGVPAGNCQRTRRPCRLSPLH